MISRHAVAVALVALTSSQPAWAQSESRITGVVRDATGAVSSGCNRHRHESGHQRFADRDDGGRRQLLDLRCRRRHTQWPSRCPASAGPHRMSKSRPARRSSSTSRWRRSSPRRSPSRPPSASRRCSTCRSRSRRRPRRCCALAASKTSRAWRRTWAGSPCRTSGPGRARSRCAESPPARSCAISPA